MKSAVENLPVRIPLTVVLALMLFSTDRGEAQEIPDTLLVSGPAVVFFGPSESERDSLRRRDGEGIEEAIDDYLLYAGKIRPFLDSVSIATLETNRESFVIARQGKQPRLYDRDSLGADLGFILLKNGKEPKVLPGVHTDEELRDAVEAYFGLRPRAPGGDRGEH